MSEPKVLTLDIETAPAHALVFGQFKVNISNIQIIKPDRVIGIGAKWHHEDKVLWRSEYHNSRESMIQWVAGLLNDADIAVHFNGSTFDMPWIRREMALMGMLPHSPVQEVDLLKACRKQFRFTSYKLEAMVKAFGLSEKMDTGGFGLWRAIEVGDEAEQRKAWSVMRTYCKNDVAITEKLYDELHDRGWLPSHPNMGLFVDGEQASCHNCGSEDLRSDGYCYTKGSRFPRWQCRQCGKYGRPTKRDRGAEIVAAL